MNNHCKQNRHFKKALFGFLTLLQFAIPASAKWVGTPLVGVSGGIVRYSGQYGVGLLQNNFPNIPRFDFIDDFRSYGALWGALAGYRVQCEGWLWGAELSVDWDDAGKDHDLGFPQSRPVFNAKNRFSDSPRGALTGTFGYQMSPIFIAYLRAGVQVSQDKLYASFVNVPGAYPDLESNSVTKERVFRPLLGLGAEFPFCIKRQLGFRLEYNYHAQAEKIETGSEVTDNLISPVFSTNTRPKIHSIKGSLIWNII